MSVLFLITARGGSKGVPRKNLQEIGGLSLIGWKARQAQSVMLSYCSDAALIISTEDAEMQADAKRHGVDVPFTRPPELATDDAASADVVLHAMSWIQDNWGRAFDQVMLLEPSSPFATSNDFREALVMSAVSRADLVAGMRRTEPNTAFIGQEPDDKFITHIIVNMQRAGRHLRRQDLRPEWTMNGALYLFGWEMFKRTHDIYGGARNFGLMMDEWRSIEIDTPKDLEMARYAVSAGHVAVPEPLSRWHKILMKHVLKERKA